MARRGAKWEDDDDDDLGDDFDFGDDDDEGDENDEGEDEEVEAEEQPPVRGKRRRGADTRDEDREEAAGAADNGTKEEAAPPVEAEESDEPDPASLPPDNQDAIAALRDVGCRVDVNEQGRVWRVFLYEKNRDQDAAQIHGFPMLREIWLLGSKVTPPFVERLKAEFPKAKVFA
jgi:hypothetical protein